MRPQKLTPGEITAVVEKIRKKYDDYIHRFFKPQSLRRAFEERYIRALRASVDISSFLIAEIGAIEELTAKEEEHVVAAPTPEPTEPGIAEKVLEENRRRIAKYSPVAFHKDASEEVQRLLGALRAIADEHWPALSSALRDTASNMNSVEMLNLDSQLRFLAIADRDGVPPLLGRYVGQLQRFPRNYPVIDREEKDYILEVAFFLNDLYSMLERVRRVYTDLRQEAKETLGVAVAYLWGVISDFRLKDLRRRKP